MNSTIYGAFRSVLSGKNLRVVQLPHPRVVFLAQNFNGRAALVANIVLRPDQLLADGRGFSASTDRSGSGSVVRLSSNDDGLNLLFLKLVDYVLERTAEARNAEEAATLLVVAVDEFRTFSQRRPGLLSEEEVRGLVAELLFLLHLHAQDPRSTWDVFHAWGGPFGALHDFEFAEGSAIEVKSTHNPPAEIRITSPAQTQPLPDGLDLVVLPLEKVAPGSESGVRLTELVAEVTSLATSYGGDVADLWDTIVDALGLDMSDQYYERWQFLRGDWLRYAVADGFPGIYETDIPTGVVKVTYSLRLDSLQPFAAEFADLEVLP